MKAVIHGRQGEPFQAATPFARGGHTLPTLNRALLELRSEHIKCKKVAYRFYSCTGDKLLQVFLQTSLSDDFNQVATASPIVF